MNAIGILARAALGVGLMACATPERRAEPGNEPNPPTTANDAAPDAVPAPATQAGPATTAGAPDVLGSYTTVEGPVAELTPDKKKILEEYRALALKNDCSRGYSRLPGQWRFVGETRTPNYASVITIDGTKFQEKLSGNPDGKYLSATIQGEIRCAFKNRVLVTIDKVTPEGAYGNASGDSYPCDVLGDMDPSVERILMICYFDWDLRTAAGYEYEYERIVNKPAP